MEATPGQQRIVLITGLSGAGRTQVAKVLEDLDYFVMDNLPPTLIGRVAELAFAPGAATDRIALVTDIRARQFGPLVDTIRELRDVGRNVQVLYLEADDDSLVRRFEATRRRHPAAVESEGVLQGIVNERAAMSEVRGMADLIVDTSQLNVHELRDLVIAALGDPAAATLRIKVVSFGFKYGTPRDADVVLDVRFLPNPHWIEALRPYTGRDEPVREYVLHQEASQPFLAAVHALLDASVPGFVAEGKRYLTIAIGCTGGKHRSVAVSEEVGAYLRATHEVPVTVEHRDLGEE